jgi:hypothetical protein
MKKSYLIALAATVFIGAGGVEKRMRKPPNISPETMKALGERMNGHGLAMMGLSLSVVLLEYDMVQKMAEGIVAEPKLKRPATSDPLRSLPPRFFELQDELPVRAQALADAAKKKNDAEIGTAYARMTETCVACHSIYLAPAKVQ